MRRANAQPLAALLQAFLRSNGLETPLNQHRLLEAWPQVMGPTIARYTGRRFIRNQTLYVQVLSGPLKQDLQLSSKAIVEKLNRYVGAQVIAQVQFY